MFIDLKKGLSYAVRIACLIKLPGGVNAFAKLDGTVRRSSRSSLAAPAPG